MMPSGRRDKLVTLQSAGTPTADVDGAPVIVYSTLATAYAAIEPAATSSLERLAAGTVISQATHTVTIPYLANVLTTSRVLLGARRFDVQSIVNPREANRELVLVVTERVQ